MKKNNLIIKKITVILFFLLSPFIGFSQEAEIVKGKVFDENDNVLPGVTVVEKGSANNATTTNANGEFSINLNNADVLVFSFLGYKTQEVSVGQNKVVDVKLLPDAKNLETVVITALGIEKSEKSITYATAEVAPKEMNTIKTTNFANTLTGKVSGLNIQKGSGGVGSSNRIILRGIRSVSGNNQALIVIDGIPVSNFYGGTPPTSTWNNDNDRGDLLSQINPEDIEKVSVLKGAAAASLYGSDASNGVIFITTRKGGLDQKMKIDYSYNFSGDNALYVPELQTKYGAVASSGDPTASSPKSWSTTALGKTYDFNSSTSKDIINTQTRAMNFFQTGLSHINSLSLSSSFKSTQFFASYANTTSTGIYPGNTLNRHNISMRSSSSFFKDILEVDGKFIMSIQNVENRPTDGILYNSSIGGLYLAPANYYFDEKNYYVKNEARNIDVMNWYATGGNDPQNPYWYANKLKNYSSSERYLFNLSIKANITKFLSLQIRGNYDRNDNKFERKQYAGSNSVSTPSSGRYILSTPNITEFYIDGIINFSKTFFKDFHASALLGASYRDSRQGGYSFDNDQVALAQTNFFDLTSYTGNINKSTLTSSRLLGSFFYNVEFSYKNFVFVTHSGRNDWSSTLDVNNNSYYYPSVGLSVVPTELVNLNKIGVSYIKGRFSYALVGKDVEPYVSNRGATINNTGAVVNPTQGIIPGYPLKPEISTSIEGGIDLGFLQNKINFGITFYKTNTVNQFFTITAPASSGLSQYLVNGGDIENRGIEFNISGNLTKKSFSWNSSIAWSNNESEVIALHNKVNRFIVGGTGTNNYGMILEKGSSLGDIWAYRLKRINGKLVVDDNLIPQLGTDYEKVGNSMPKFLASWTNSFSFKNITLSFMVDSRIGGNVISFTESLLDEYGRSIRTEKARDNNGVSINGVLADGTPKSGTISAENYYSAVGGRDKAVGEYLYDATNIRLRELSVGYSIPKNIVAKISKQIVKGISANFVMRNVFFIYNAAPYDPELTTSVGNALQGVDLFALPATRTIGFTLKFEF